MADTYFIIILSRAWGAGALKDLFFKNIYNFGGACAKDEQMFVSAQLCFN